MFHMKLQPIRAHNQFIGYIGETEAIKFLRKQGHTILRRNYRNRFGEINIISFDPNKTLCFYEVKTIVVKERFLEKKRGEEVIKKDCLHQDENDLSRNKRGCMMRATEGYLASFPVDDPYWEAHGIVVHLKENLECLPIEVVPYVNTQVS